MAEQRSKPVKRTASEMQRAAHARSRSRARAQEVRAARHGRLGKGLIATFLLASAIIFFGGLVLSGRALPLPPTLRTQVVEVIAERLPEASVSIDDVAVMLGPNGAPRVRMENLAFGDLGGGGVAVLNGLTAHLSPAALLRGRLQPERLVLDGAQVTVRRSRDGTLALDAGSGGANTEFNLPGLLSALDAALESGPLSSIEEASAEGMVITLEDARSGGIWQATNAAIVLRRSETGLTASVTSDVFNGTDSVAEVQVSLTYESGSGDLGLGIRLVDVAAIDIAAQSPALAWLGVLDAPISGSVRADVSRDGALIGLSGALDIASGALTAQAGTAPIGFQQAKAYLEFDPERQRIDFSEVSVATETLQVTAAGHSYLAEIFEGWPRAFLGQFVISELALDEERLFREPVALSGVGVDLRLRTDPFEVEVEQLATELNGQIITGKGRVSAREDGWHVSVDGQTAQIATDTVMQFWPLIEAPITRAWLDQNVRVGTLTDVTMAFRKTPGERSDIGLNFAFRGGEVQFLKDMPELIGAGGIGVISEDAFHLKMTNGGVTSSQGDWIDFSGSVFSIPDIEQKPPQGLFQLRARGDIPDILDVTNNAPLRLMERAERSPDLAQGSADIVAEFELPLKDGILVDEVTYAVTGILRDVSSDRIVPERVLTSRRMALSANADELRLVGPVALDGAGLTADWRQPLGEGGREAGSQITGVLPISSETMQTFGVPLPDGLLRGEAQAEYSLRVVPEKAPELSLTSDLRGLGLAIDALGWSKSAGTEGGLELEATLGSAPEVTRLSVSAPGLGLDGQIQLRESGGLETAVFDPVRVGSWLDARAVLTARESGQAPAIAIDGGRMDFRDFPRDQFQGGNSGDRAPISVSLDTFILSDALSFAPLVGQIESGLAGLSGDFEARVNGQTPISGALAPANGGTAIRIQSNDAGGVVRSAGFSNSATGGTLDVVLTPIPNDPNGGFRGEFLIEEIRIQDAPVMAAILDTISVVGLIDQLSGQGLRFATVDGRFRLSRDAFVLDEAAAIGGSLGISVSGLYDLNAQQIDLQGVVSPFFFLNSVGSLVSRRGEGLFGFNYSVVGPSTTPTVTVNPLSILTPGLFREIFRRAPPTN